MKSRIPTVLGIKYPIIQGGMLWLANAELAAAVSNAGGLGTISPFAGMQKGGDPLSNLRIQVARAKRLTEEPFAVNIPLDLEESGILIDVSLREGVKILITAAGDPRFYTELLHQERMSVIHVISSVNQALKAESSGVDAIVAEGCEAGGHLGFDEIPLMSLLPQVADAVSMPIIAAGGISDARGMAAAFALGAEGVQLGTRFVVAQESIAHPKYKQAIIDAMDSDTVVTCRTLLPTRSLKTDFSKRLLELESLGRSAGEISQFLGRGRARRAQLEGDLHEGEAYCGASAGLIKEIAPAGKIVERLVEEYEEVVKKLIQRE